MRRAAIALLAALALATAAPAEEAPRVPLRVGSHADHGRLVFDFPAPVGYRVEEEAGRVLLRFAAPARLDLAAARRPPRNVLAIEEEEGAVGIRVVPGARLRHFRLGNRIVLDVRDPGPAAEQAAPRGAAPSSEARGADRAPAAAPVVPAMPAPPAAAAHAAPPPVAAPVAAPAVAPEAAAAPETTAPARPAAPEAGPAATAAPAPDAQRALAALAAATPQALRALPGAAAIAIDAGPAAGLALFRRGEWVHLVLDRAVPVEPAALRGHPVFGGLEARPAGEATALRLALAPPARLVARRDGAAWIIEATREPASAEAPPLRLTSDDGPPPRLLLEGGEPGGVVTLLDPETGETLLVGTLREPGPAVAVGRRLPAFEVLPTMLGAVLVARSDRLVLRPLPGRRFAVQDAGGEGLGLGAAPGREPPPAAVAMTRLLDLPAGPVPALLERLRLALTAVHGAPPLARGPARRDAAETLLALGMAQEAQAMATLAFQEDPRAREEPRLLLAHGVAALLAGRPAEAEGIEHPALPAVDEVALWRALLALARGEAAAPALLATAPLLLDYPQPLRERLLPQVAEALVAAGEVAGAARLLEEAGDVPGLGLARAMLLEAEGRAEEALAAYAALAEGRDRRQRAAALRRMAEIRLARGALDAAGAAEALERALFAWRGGAEEVALRRRIAALRREAGDGAAAFALLDETARLFPDQAAALAPDLAEAFAAALETAPPLVAATLFDAHPSLLPGGARGEAAVLLLADRLAALDLPDRAAALLWRAAETAGDAATRAAIGARLAAMRLHGGDAAGALAALEATEAPGLEAALAERRTLVRARALARQGEGEAAEALLARLGPVGAALRAELRAEAEDWAGAAAAMAEHLAASLPPAPEPLRPEDRAALARAAAYAALAGDEAALAALREAHGARMAEGPLAEAFGVLTADPLRGLGDLPRLQRELGLMRLLPRRLEALRAGVQVAR